MDPNQTGPTDPNSPLSTASPTPNPTPEPVSFNPTSSPSFDSPINGLSPNPTAAPASPNTSPQPFAPGPTTDNPFNTAAPGVATPPSSSDPFNISTPQSPTPTTAPIPNPTGPDAAPSWDTLGNPQPSPTGAPDLSIPTNPAPPPNPNPFPAIPAPEPFPSSNPAPAGLPPWAGDNSGASAPHQEPTEPAPTDLSQLSNLGSESSVYTPPISSSPETLVVPPTNPLPNTTADTETHKKLPKGLIIGGLIVLLLVIAASAYFILGIGKPGEPQPSSLPAQQQLPLTNPPKPITQTPVTNTATGSSTFGGLGTTPATSSGQSALDLLRARQATASGAAQ